MKRIGHLYDKIISIENLQRADEKARCGKTHTYGVRVHDRNREANILALHEALLTKTYHTLNEVYHADCAEYADDIIVLSDSKDNLRKLFFEVIKPIIEGELELTVKGNYQIFPIADNRADRHGRALDYVGYKFYRHQKLIRKSIKQNFCRAVSKLSKRVPPVSPMTFKQGIAPWLGWAAHSNSKNLVKLLIPKEYVSIL